MHRAVSIVLPAFAIGATLGAVDALWRVVVLSHARPTGAVLLLVYGCFGFAFLAASAAVCVAWFSRLLAFTPPANAGFGVAVGSFAAVHFIWALVSLRQPELAWLILPCVLLGGVVGLFAHWLASVTGLSSAPTVWMAASAIVVAAGVAVVITRVGFGPSRDHPIGAERPPNVVLISIDTLRADRLGSYGYAKARTPHLDALAQSGALFETAMSPAPLTAPSHITMLAGLYPAHHGIVSNGARMAAGLSTLADWLSPAGYDSAGFVSGWTLTDEACGLAGEFALFDDDLSGSVAFPSAALRSPIVRLPILAWFMLTGRDVIRLQRPGAATTSKALAWLDDRGAAPFFLFVHYFEPHQPYTPPADLERLHDPTYEGDVHSLDQNDRESMRRVLANPRDVEHVKALYDAEVTSADREVGRLLEALTALDAPTLIIFTSDHGESLTEHSYFFGHGDLLYQPSLHVPLIVRFPSGEYAGTRVASVVRLADIAPTILEAVGLPQRRGLDGRSLLATLNGEEETNERKAFGGVGQDVRSGLSRFYARAGDDKLIWSFDDRRWLSDSPAYEELYDLRADPGELRNLVSSSPNGAALREELRAYVQARPRTSPDLPAGARENLRALGYE